VRLEAFKEGVELVGHDWAVAARRFNNLRQGGLPDAIAAKPEHR
jgi:hypothetical protein